MRLSEEIRKIADGCISEGISCSFPNYMGFDCGKTEGLECSDCTAMALMVLADKVELLERERTEDSEIAEWVRERGGLEEVKRAMQDSDNRRVELCSALGIDTVTGWSDAVVEMDKRLMPPGMELDGNVMKIRIAENVDYDGKTLFVLIGGRDE